MGQRSDPARFLLETEEQARQQQMTTVRLANGADTLAGLALFLPDLPAETLRDLLQRAGTLADTPAPQAAGGLDQTASGPGKLLALVQREIARHQESRLPCSLLLLSLADQGGKNKRRQTQALTAIEPLLDHQDTAAPCDGETIAVLLPATSLGKARRRAAEFQSAMACGPQPLCCGLSVCHAHEPLSAEEFLQRTRQELERATALGNGALCHAALATIDESCQVTVEERAELFSFLA